MTKKCKSCTKFFFNTAMLYLFGKGKRIKIRPTLYGVFLHVLYHSRTFLYAKRLRYLTIIEGSLYTGGSTKLLGAVVIFLAQREISSNTVILTMSFELLEL